MKILLATRRLTLRINKRKIQHLAETLFAFSYPSAKRHASPAYDTITLVITSNIGITPINRLALNHEGPTDVITLAYAATPRTPASAEIFVNAQRAIEVAEQTRISPWSPNHELALYIAHGFDHLAGYDDAIPNEARNMRNRERGWVRRTDTLGLVDGLFR